uniref:Translation elongation factor, putative n=1 Tax=Theileria annulata TaxID=5874 RepID=A0A3B0NG86_THEAN
MLFFTLIFIFLLHITKSNCFSFSHKTHFQPFNYRNHSINSNTPNGVNVNTSENDVVEGIESERSKKIKLLRSSTGRGAQECYKALIKANGDVKLASQIILNTLNEHKDSSNNGGEIVMLLEGTIALSCTDKVCCMVDVRCDTDFVSKNKLFTSFAKSFCNSSLHSFIQHSNTETTQTFDDFRNEILNNPCLRCGKTVGETGKFVKGALRESISVARISFLESDPGDFFVSYIHSSLDPKFSPSYSGTAGSILSFQIGDYNSFYNYYNESDTSGLSRDGEDGQMGLNCCLEGKECIYSDVKNVTEFNRDLETDELKIFLREIAIHAVAEKPKEIDIERFDSGGSAELEKELESLISSGKSKEIAERILKGKLRKKYGQDVLMEQVWTFGDGNESVSEVIEKMSKKVSREIKLKKYISYAISDDLINYKHPQNCTFYNTNIAF